MIDPRLCFAIATLLALALVRRIRVQRSKLSLPPGPKPLPLIGNILDFPPKGEAECLHWIKHKDIYGPISSMGALGQTIILIHDRGAATELLVKRAANYSDRPVATFANDMCGFSEYVLTQQLGPKLRSLRKLAHSHLVTQRALSKFEATLDVAAQRLLLRLLDHSAGLEHEIHTMTSAMLMKIFFGYNTSEYTLGRDPLQDLNDRLLQDTNTAFAPGWLVDLVPLLKYAPTWLPGTGFKAFAREARKNIQAQSEIPFGFVRRMERPESSFVGDLLKARDQGNITSDYDIQWTAASSAAAGVETITAELMSFFLAMSLFPHVQTRAQQEIDDLLGAESGRRTPVINDRTRLPYVNALVKEVLRWLPATPMGVPHVARGDDEYHGFRIPKGSIVFAGVWWFTRDPAVYQEPDAFKPERYLPPYNEPDPESFVFGFGRRICTGRKLALDIMFLSVAKSLAVFNVLKSLDEKGRETPASLAFEPGLVTRLRPFSVNIVPRSRVHAELARSVEREHPFEQGDARFVEDDLRDFLGRTQ